MQPVGAVKHHTPTFRAEVREVALLRFSEDLPYHATARETENCD